MMLRRIVQTAPYAAVSLLVACILACAGTGRNGTRAVQHGPIASSFVITDLRAEWQGGRFRALGEVHNHGTLAGGPQLVLTARDANGRVIDSQTMWPASVQNIAPGDSAPIAYTVTMDSRAVSVEARVVSVTSW